MIYIDTNHNPEKFLASNTYYDHKGVCLFKRMSRLAYVLK
jgi:hypothetical protein